MSSFPASTTFGTDPGQPYHQGPGAPAYGQPVAAAPAHGQPAAAPVYPRPGVAPVVQVLPIGTPLAVASLRRRVAAYAIDVTIVTIVQALITALLTSVFVAGVTSAAENGTYPSAATLIGAGSVIVVLNLIAAFLFLGVIPSNQGTWNGRTIGKRVLGIKAVRVDGRPYGLVTGLLRTATFQGPLWLGYLAGMIIDAAAGTGSTFTYIGVGLSALYTLVDEVFAPLTGAHRLTLHDRVSSTVVVELSPSFVLAASASPTPSADPYVGTEPGAVGHTFVGREKTPGSYALASIHGLLLTLAVLILLSVAITDSAAHGDSGENPFVPGSPAVTAPSHGDTSIA